MTQIHYMNLSWIIGVQDTIFKRQADQECLDGLTVMSKRR
jgi:hypothetical protein